MALLPADQTALTTAYQAWLDTDAGKASYAVKAAVGGIDNAEAAQMATEFKTWVALAPNLTTHAVAAAASANPAKLVDVTTHLNNLAKISTPTPAPAAPPAPEINAGTFMGPGLLALILGVIGWIFGGGIGAVAGAVLGGMGGDLLQNGGNGLIGSLLGSVIPGVRSIEPGIAPGTIPGTTMAQAAIKFNGDLQVLKEGKFISGTGSDGNLTYSTTPKEIKIVERDPVSGKIFSVMTGSVDPDGEHFNVTSVARALPDGKTPGEIVKIEPPAQLLINMGNGEVSFAGNAAINAAYTESYNKNEEKSLKANGERIVNAINGAPKVAGNLPESAANAADALIPALHPILEEAGVKNPNAKALIASRIVNFYREAGNRDAGGAEAPIEARLSTYLQGMDGGMAAVDADRIAKSVIKYNDRIASGLSAIAGGGPIADMTTAKDAVLAAPANYGIAIPKHPVPIR